MLGSFSSLVVVCLAVGLVQVRSTPLDDYVNEPDSHYSYTLIKTYTQVGYKLYVLNMTSQKWMDETYVKNPIWWHYLVITIPDKITRPDAGLILIDGGSQNDGIPKPTDNFVELTSMFAVSTGTIAADLQQIPNQPTVFLKDPTLKNRYEDAVIAWTWKTFVENPDDPMSARQLLRLPMTKAAVRAMDTVTDFASKTAQVKVDKFLVAGASKRGWTTWTTMAVDKRVFAAIPIVMDMLSLNTNLHTHYRSLGGYTFAFNDYYELNITRYVDSYGMFAMQKIIDPYTYLDRYRNIKTLMVVTGGDEFFLPEDTHAYWKDLVAATDGSILIRRLPNAEHSCAGHEISLFFSLRSFFLTVYEKNQLPKLTWSRANNRTHGIIEATVDLKNGPRPSDVKVYYAKTLDGKRKDFRLVIGDPKDPSKAIPHPVIWEKTTSVLKTDETPAQINYKAAFPKPITGWFAFFIQFDFPSVEESVIVVTTETNVIPDTFPFDDCTLDGCFGKLV